MPTFLERIDSITKWFFLIANIYCLMMLLFLFVAQLDILPEFAGEALRFISEVMFLGFALVVIGTGGVGFAIMYVFSLLWLAIRSSIKSRTE